MKLYRILVLLLILVFNGCTNSKMQMSKFNDKEEYFILRGENYSQEKKYLEAIKEFKQAYSKNPKNKITLIEMAFCYGELGYTDEALKYYLEALKVDPKDVVAIKNISYLYYRLGRLEEAEKHLKILPDRMEDAYVYKINGFIALDKKKYKESYIYLTKAVNLTNTYDGDLFRRYVEVLKNLNQHSRIYDFLESKYSLYKNRKSFVILYAMTLHENFSELQKSERALKRYMAEQSKDDELIIMLAKNNIEQKKYRQAREILSLVSSKNKYNPEYVKIKKELEKL